MAFFEKVEVESLKCRLAGTLSNAWPPDRAEEGLQFVIENRPFFSHWGIMYHDVVGKALTSAARGGPAAVRAMLVTLKEHDLEARYCRNIEFPRGFDFRALAESPECLEEGFHIHAWIEAEPDGAFEALVSERRLNDAIPFETILRTNGTEVHPADRAEWLASRIATLDDSQRTRIADTLRQSPEVLGTFAKALRDPAERLAFSETASEALASPGNLSDYIEFLEAAGPPAERIDLLEVMSPHIVRRFESTLRERMTEWGAPPERIDSISSRYKPH